MVANLNFIWDPNQANGNNIFPHLNLKLNIIVIAYNNLIDRGLTPVIGLWF